MDILYKLRHHPQGLCAVEGLREHIIYQMYQKWSGKRVITDITKKLSSSSPQVRADGEALTDLGSLMSMKMMRRQRNRGQMVVLSCQTISVMANKVEGRSSGLCLTHTELWRWLMEHGVPTESRQGCKDGRTGDWGWLKSHNLFSQSQT